MPSAVNLGSLEFTSLVPTWIIIFSGSFLRMGLIVFHVLSCCTRKGLCDHLVGFRKAPTTDVLDH